MKKLKIEINKHTFIISVLKVEYQVFLVSLISNFFTNKISLANKWMSFSGSNLALECPYFFDLTPFLRLGQKYKNIFVHFLVQMKTSKLTDLYFPEKVIQTFYSSFHI